MGRKSGWIQSVFRHVLVVNKEIIMYNLEFIFLKNLSEACLSRYSKLNQYYTEYINCLTVNEYDYHLDYFSTDKFMRYLGNTLLQNHYNHVKIDVEEYNDIPNLLIFIYHIKLLAKKELEKIKENSYVDFNYILNNYQYADSQLSSIYINRMENTCVIELKGVIAYGDKRILVNDDDIEYIDMIITFEQVNSIHCKGNILGYQEEYGGSAHHVYMSSIIKESDIDYRFMLLCDAAYDYTALEIEYREVKVKKKSLLE